MNLTSRPWKAPDGPHWIKGARRGIGQTDGRGTIWTVVGVAKGGRELRWMSAETPERIAITIATETHPDYPSDAQVIAAERAAKKEAAASANPFGYFFP